MQYGTLDFLRHVNHHEVGHRVEVIFPALIDDPDIAVTGSLFIRQHPINFVAF